MDRRVDLVLWGVRIAERLTLIAKGGMLVQFAATLQNCIYLNIHIYVYSFQGVSLHLCLLLFPQLASEAPPPFRQGTVVPLPLPAPPVADRQPSGRRRGVRHAVM